MDALDDIEGLIDWRRVEAWIETQPGVPGRGPITAVERMSGGTQNYLIRVEREGGVFVLRRPPRHLRPNSNETMLREARVLAALGGSDVPHPSFIAGCADESVIGTCFTMMECINGAPIAGQLAEAYGGDPSAQRSVYFELVDAAASLGRVDINAVGLRDFGRSERWLERQVERWRKQLDGYSQFDGYGTSQLPHVDAVGRWLDQQRPKTCHIGLIHGDYGFHNVLFARDTPRLLAIVDWELCTLGDPLLDLAQVVVMRDDTSHGPSNEELVERYVAANNRDRADFTWFCVLAAYRLGIILDGTHARAGAGLAPRETGDALHAHAIRLLERAGQLIDVR